MKDIRSILTFAKYFILSRYGYATIILLFAVWIMFFDNRNKIKQMNLKIENRELKKENARLKHTIADNIKNIELLSKDKFEIEKYAREKYRMKAPNEDVFLFEE